MCFQDGKCPFTGAIETFLKGRKLIDNNDQLLKELAFNPVLRLEGEI
jgi:hypothetical protein